MPGRRPPVAVLLLLLVVAAGLLPGCGRRGAQDAGPSGSGPTTPPTQGSPGGAVSRAAATGTVERGEVTTPDGRTRTWHLYVPSSLPPGPVPLVVALHGGLGSGAQLEDSTGLDEVAEAAGVLVAYPDGVGSAVGDDHGTWNAGSCCGSAARDDVDDVGFVRTVVDQVGADHDVDPSRVLAIGHSNGGMLAFRLACEAADVITGIGAVGSSLEVEPCEPAEPVSVALVHGLADDHHPYEGGEGDRSISGVAYRPARAGVELLARADGCAEPTEDRDGDLTVITWTGCAQGTGVRITTIDGASHAWPGGTAGAPRLVGEPYPGYDASAELTAFLLDHPRR